MAMWTEIFGSFEKAVRVGDTDLVERILRYAAWCTSERAGPLPSDTSTAVACAFYEHLPERRDYWASFSAWFTPQEFERLLPIFGYHLSEADLAELKESFSDAA